MARILSQTGNEHHDPVRQNEKHEPAKRDKVDGTGRLPVEHGPEKAHSVRNCRALHETRQNRNRRGDEHRDEIRELLQAIVPGPAFVNRKVQGSILESGRERGREHAPRHGNQTKPLTGGENQHVKRNAVDRPQHHDRQMPPTGEPYRMTNARKT